MKERTIAVRPCDASVLRLVPALALLTIIGLLQAGSARFVAEGHSLEAGFGLGAERTVSIWDRPSHGSRLFKQGACFVAVAEAVGGEIGVELDRTWRAALGLAACNVKYVSGINYVTFSVLPVSFSLTRYIDDAHVPHPSQITASVSAGIGPCYPGENLVNPFLETTVSVNAWRNCGSYLVGTGLQVGRIVVESLDWGSRSETGFVKIGFGVRVGP